MSDPVDALILDLLEWVGRGARSYAEVIEAWQTSCPRLPVWEEANQRGFIDQHHDVLNGRTVSVSALGFRHLRAMRDRAAAAVLTAQAQRERRSAVPVGRA
jgi:D-3-phosphoglycerate dehydrogenase